MPYTDESVAARTSRMRDAGLRQLPHHLRARECLCQKDHVRVDVLDVIDQPLPEGQWFRVRVVDSEHADAAVRPLKHDVTPRGPQPLPIRRPEVEWINILVFLGRIFGELYGAIRAVIEPLRVLL